MYSTKKLQLFLATVLCVAAYLAAVSDAQCTKSTVDFRFKTASEKGQPSFINLAGAPVSLTVNERLPPIVVQVRYSDWRSAGRVLPDFSMNGFSVEVSITPQLRMSGNSVELNQGEALFTSLEVQEDPDPSTSYKLIFTIVGSAEHSPLETGTIAFIAPLPAAALTTIRFGNYGFFFRPDRVNFIPVGEPLPMFFIEGLDRIGRRFAGQLSVTVECQELVGVDQNPGGVCSPAPSPSRGDGTGVVTFGNFVFNSATADISGAIFTFKSEDGSGNPISISCTVSTVAAVSRNQFMEFDNRESFFAYNNIGDTAVRDVPLPPIKIKLLTSKMQPDTSNTGLVITASTESGNLRGAEALVSRGVAEFRDLAFTDFAPRGAVITFVAGRQGGLPVQSQQLFSGAVEVTETSVKAKHLSFAKSSAVQGVDSLKVRLNQNGTQNFAVPSVVIQVKDSAYQIDSTASGFDVVITVDASQGLVANPSRAAVVNGIASFGEVKIFAAGGGAISPATVNLRITDEGKIRTPLISGPVVVEQGSAITDQVTACKSGAAGCGLRLEFSDSAVSFVYEQEQRIFATMNAKIPDIRVRVRDEFGNIPAFVATPQLIVFTSDEPNADSVLARDGGALPKGKWIAESGEFWFGDNMCVFFSAMPDGLVRLKFRLLDTDDTRFRGISDIRTGFVTVLANPTSNYGLRFGQSGDSLINYIGQRSSSVVNIAMPSIVIEMINSLGEFDDSNSDVEILATVSAGQLDSNGARVQMTKGRAVFSALKFTSIGDEPVMTFTARVTSWGVSGKSVATGGITITTLPIRPYRIAFDSSDATRVQYEYQPFTFGTDIGQVGMVVASIAIRDSAHQDEDLSTQPLSANVRFRITGIGGLADAPGVTNQVSIDRNNDRAVLGFSIPTGVEINPANVGYLRYTVESSSFPSLVGQYLTVGPIRVAANTGVTCAAGLDSPVTVVEFRMNLATFIANEEEIKKLVAELMGIRSSRVRFDNATWVETTTINPSQIQTYWTIAKVQVQFGDVEADSTNRKSSAELAEEFLSLRPQCDTKLLCIAAVYPVSADKTCKTADWLTSRQDAESCAERCDTCDSCACYEEYVFGNDNGQRCAGVPANEDTFYEDCRLLTACTSTVIKGVCEDILKKRAQNVIWMWASVGSVAGAALLLYSFKKYGFSVKFKKLTMHSRTEI